MSKLHADYVPRNGSGENGGRVTSWKEYNRAADQWWHCRALIDPDTNEIISRIDCFKQKMCQNARNEESRVVNYILEPVDPID